VLARGRFPACCVRWRDHLRSCSCPVDDATSASQFLASFYNALTKVTFSTPQGEHYRTLVKDLVNVATLLLNKIFLRSPAADSDSNLVETDMYPTLTEVPLPCYSLPIFSMLDW